MFYSQRVPLYYHYGIGYQKTISIMVWGTKFHNSRVYGPSGSIHIHIYIYIFIISNGDICFSKVQSRIIFDGFKVQRSAAVTPGKVLGLNEYQYYFGDSLF